MKITLMSKEEWYEVEFEGKDYSLQYHKDENIGWSNIEIFDEDGNEIEDEVLIDKIVEAFDKEMINEKV